MSIYHLSVKIIGRSGGCSAVAAAAYRSGDKLYEKEKGKSYDYSRKSGIAYSEIMLPENAPADFMDREILWNSVEEIEKQSNAQFSREVEVALPVELSDEERLDVLHRFVKRNFVDEGMVADFSIHDKGDGNPHAHIMLTTRGFNKGGSWASKEKKAYALDESGNKIPIIDPETGEQKIGARGRKMWQRVTVQANDWNRKERFTAWRQSWADICNEYLSEDKRIDHRSFKDRGIELIPTVHEGYAARKIEREGGLSDRSQINRAVKAANEKIKIMVEQLQEIAAEKLGIKEKEEPSKYSAEIQKQNTGLVFVRLPIELCELNIPFPRSKDSSVRYNKFTMPQGSVINGKDVSGAVFFHIAAEIDKSDADYCIAPFPRKFHVELNIEKPGEPRERVSTTPLEVVEAIDNSEQVCLEWEKEAQRVRFLEPEKAPEPEPAISHRKQRQRDLDDGFEL